MTATTKTKKGTCSYCEGIGLLEATDIFCGAGGSSLGLEYVQCPLCGRQLIKVVQGLNHWDLAVQAHNANFPDADHDVHDIEDIPPSRFRRTPILWASPECVHHAYCRGRKGDDESAERSRATMSDVVRFTRYHRYDVVIVENVIEARLWGPFDNWFKSMCALGYEGKIVYFNSQFALPTPQSRDRMYCFFSRKGLKKPELDFKPSSWCGECEEIVQGVQTWKKATKGSLRSEAGKFEWGRYGQQYTYNCPRCTKPVAPAVMGAKTIIDWNIPMIRIGDRAQHGLPPLAPNSRNRIKNGLVRLQTDQPVTVQVGGHTYERSNKYARVWSVHDVLRCVTGTPYMGLVVPNMNNNTGGSAEKPLGAVTSGNRFMLIKVNRGGNDKRRALPIDEPLHTVAGHGETALVSFRNHGDMQPIDTPAYTVCGGGYHHGLLVYNGNPGFVRHLEDAAGTVTARDKQSLLVPYYSQAKSGRTTDLPMGVVTGKDRQGLVIVEPTDADIDACMFRMLKWPELLRAQMMHMHPDGRDYELTARVRSKKNGKIRDLSDEKRTKMIGNAVSSPVATMLGQEAVEILR